MVEYNPDSCFCQAVGVTPKTALAGILEFRYKILSSNRECLGEEFGEDCQDVEPGTHYDKDPTTPTLHLHHMSTKGSDDRLLSGGDGGGQQEHQEHDDQCSVGKGHQGRPETPQGQGVPGQTGQDRPRSTKPGQQVAEAEHGETEDRVLSPDAGLRLHQRA
jgi:hypothetical protein